MPLVYTILRYSTAELVVYGVTSSKIHIQVSVIE